MPSKRERGGRFSGGDRRDLDKVLSEDLGMPARSVVGGWGGWGGGGGGLWWGWVVWGFC